MSLSPTMQMMTAGETRTAFIRYTDKLESGELLTGTPTITISPSAGVTLSNKAVSTAILTINGKSTAIGAAVSVKITGVTAATIYTLSVTVGTDATVAQTFVDTFEFEAD